ncbi:galactofuranose ABC transporter, permease protein YjfF [Vallicoccus soli]|uniref:galactofuranose ABC transporter, permease protein YjfF n=1 Tax=Vallicoccus soli TaxID=2339232 RepID=UPI00319E14B4
MPPQRFVPVIATFVLFVAMFGAGSARYEGFGDPQVFLTLFVDNAYLIVLAVGMTFVILTGGIDLSVGSVVALTGMVASWALQEGWSAPVVIAAVLLMGTAFGLVQGAIIAVFDIQPFIVTLAGLFFARGLCYLISTESFPIRDDTFISLASGSLELPGGYYVSYTAVAAVAVVAVAAFVLHLTRFGRTVYAIGGSEASAVLMGLQVRRTKIAVYAVSGLCASLGGLLFALYSLSGYPLAALGMELDAIAAVVIGGTLLSGGVGFVVGSMLGVLVFGTILTLINFDGTLSSWWTRIVIGALLLAFIVMQRAFLRARA